MAVAAGDTLVRGASAWLRRPKGTNGHVLKGTGWGAPAAGATDVSAIRDQLSYLMFRKDAGYVNLNGYMFDAFSDQTGVDDTASLNESYDADNDLYESTAVTATIDTLAETDANLDAYIGEGAEFNGQAITIAYPSSVKKASFYLKKAGTPSGNMTARIYAATGTVGTDATGTGSVLAESAAINASTLDTSYAWTEFTFAATLDLAPGDYVVGVYCGIAYDASNQVKARMHYNGGDSIHAGNWTHYESSWHGPTYAGDDFCFVLTSATGQLNATIISEASTASSAPETARVSLFVNPVDALTLNTDLKAYATSDGGTHWDQVTLAKVADLGTTLDWYSGEVSLTGGGTTMQIKMTTHNNKAFELTAWGLSWF